LKRFLVKLKEERKNKLKEDELFCFKCQLPRKPVSGSIQVVATGKTIGKKRGKQLMKKARCNVCNTKMNRILQVYRKGLKDSEP